MTKFKFSHIKKTAIVARMKGDFNFQVYYIFWGIHEGTKKIFAFRKNAYVRNKREEKRAVTQTWKDMIPYLAKGVAMNNNEGMEYKITGVEAIEKIPEAYKDYMKFYYEN